MANVPKPTVTVIYEGRDISQDLKEHVLSVEYTDNVKGTSDEIAIQLEDIEGNWRNNWYPQKNDTMTVRIGYDDGNVVECGTFKVDEIELAGPPDTVTIKALAAPTSKSLRTKKSKGHEGKSLRQLAETVADENNLTVDDGTHSAIRPGPSSEDRAILEVYGKDLSRVSATPGTVVYAKSRWDSDQKYVEQVIGSLEAKGYTKEVAILRQKHDTIVALFARETTYDETTGAEKPGYTPIEAFTQVYAIGLQMQFTYTQLNGLNYAIPVVIQGVLNGIYFTRVTQNNETDMEFLSRVCEDFGIVFSIRDDKLIFTSIYNLEGAGAITSIARTECKSYSFKDKITGTYAKAVLKYHDPSSGTTVAAEYGVQTLVNADNVPYKQITAPDTLVIHTRAENKQQAEQIAQARLHEKNTKGTTGQLEIVGDPKLVAGVNFDLTGFGNLSGIFHITKSSHKITRNDGYVTDIEFKGVGTTRAAAKTAPSPTFAPTVRPDDYNTAIVNQ